MNITELYSYFLLFIYGQTLQLYYLARNLIICKSCMILYLKQIGKYRTQDGKQLLLVIHEETLDSS